MDSWSAEDAKARFGELLSACLSEGPQLVTWQGEETAVLVPITQWRRLCKVAPPSLKCLLLAQSGRTDLELPQRHQRKSRR